MTRLKLILFFAVLSLGFFLRIHNYDIYPQRGATSDEYSYSFMGVSLLTTGKPTSWSAFKEYGEKKDLTIRGIYFPIVSPYFDHTPLNGIVVGAFALLNGQNTFDKIQLSTIRLVPIFLTIVSSVFLFLIGRDLFGFKTGLWALLIYSTTVIFVVQSRVVLAENLVTPLLLAAIYIFNKTKKNFKTRTVIALAVISGLSFWAKELGIVTYFSILYLMFSEKVKLSKIIYFSLISLGIIFAYVLYGAYFDWELFKGIMTAQTGRVIGPETLLYILSTPIIIDKFYYDGWYFLGFVSFFIAMLSYKENKIVLVPALVYFLLMLFFLTERGEMGWYLIPLFPFFALFIAKLLVEHTQKIGFGIILFLIFIGMYVIEYGFRSNFGLSSIQFRIMLLIIFLPVLYSVVFDKKRLYTQLANFWFYFFIIMNIWLTYNYIHPL